MSYTDANMALTLLPMLWAFVLTAACGAAWLTRHDAMVARVGLEVEVLKKHAAASNTSFAHYLRTISDGYINAQGRGTTTIPATTPRWCRIVAQRRRRPKRRSSRLAARLGSHP